MSREERKIYHGKQTRDTGGQGVPHVSQMDEGVGVFRTTANGVIQYVKLNGVLYESAKFIRKEAPVNIDDALPSTTLTDKLNLILKALRRYGIIS